MYARIAGGQRELCDWALAQMRDEGLTPSAVTYSKIITAYGDSGQWEMALHTFSEVISNCRSASNSNVIRMFETLNPKPYILNPKP